MLTYDDTPEIRRLANRYNLQYRTIPMKTTLHFEKNELIISDNFSWWKENNSRQKKIWQLWADESYRWHL